MWVQKCDICGEEKETKKFRYKIKVEKETASWENHWWTKLDICDDCQERIVKFIKGWKEDDRIRQENERKVSGYVTIH